MEESKNNRVRVEEGRGSKKKGCIKVQADLSLIIIF